MYGKRPKVVMRQEEREDAPKSEKCFPFLLRTKTTKGGERMIAEFKVSGIHCNSCISLIKMNIQELEGIAEVTADNESNTVKVAFDENATTAKDIIKKIETDGYKVVQYNKKKK